jgi:hypothetical protein
LQIPLLSHLYHSTIICLAYFIVHKSKKIIGYKGPLYQEDGNASSEGSLYAEQKVLVDQISDEEQEDYIDNKEVNRKFISIIK